MILLHQPDPYIEMGSTLATHTDRASLEAHVADHFEYWNGMTQPGGEFPEGTVVTLNTDYLRDPSVYFLTITVPEAYAAEHAAKHGHPYPVHQTDLFFVIRDDTTEPPGEGDISEINGAQCGDCGAVNVILPGITAQSDLPEGVRPVWRQDREGPNLLCDPCADIHTH